MQFTSALAAQLYAVGDHEGAVVLAAWAEKRGMRVLNQYWEPFRGSELGAYREGLSASERDHATRVSASLDDATVVSYARSRVASLGTVKGE